MLQTFFYGPSLFSIVRIYIQILTSYCHSSQIYLIEHKVLVDSCFSIVLYMMSGNRTPKTSTLKLARLLSTTQRQKFPCGLVGLSCAGLCLAVFGCVRNVLGCAGLCLVGFVF